MWLFSIFLYTGNCFRNQRNAPTDRLLLCCCPKRPIHPCSGAFFLLLLFIMQPAIPHITEEGTQEWATQTGRYTLGIISIHMPRICYVSSCIGMHVLVKGMPSQEIYPFSTPPSVRFFTSTFCYAGLYGTKGEGIHRKPRGFSKKKVCIGTLLHSLKILHSRTATTEIGDSLFIPPCPCLIQDPLNPVD